VAPAGGLPHVGFDTVLVVDQHSCPAGSNVAVVGPTWVGWLAAS
jgi:hypothetical protein